MLKVQTKKGRVFNPSPKFWFGARRIIFALILFCFVFFPLNADAITRSEKQRQLDALNKQMAEQRALLAQKEKEAQTLANEIALIDGQIREAELALEATKIEIDNTNDDIAQKEEELRQQKKILAESLKLMYEEQETSLLETLLSSKSFSAVLDRMEYLNVVKTKIDSTIKGIEQIKVELEQKRNDLEKLKIEQEGITQSLNIQQAAKNQLLVETQGQEALYQQRLAANKKQYDQVSTMQAEEDYSRGGGGTNCGTFYFKGYFKWPLTPRYGVGRVGCSGGYSGHTGIDFSNYYGAPIFASADGTVVNVHNPHSDDFNTCCCSTCGDYGNYVDISHITPYGTYYTRYAHMLQSIPVYVNQPVKGVATIIGYQGNTGNSSASHIHFEIRTGLNYGAWVDPLPFLP